MGLAAAQLTSQCVLNRRVSSGRGVRASNSEESETIDAPNEDSRRLEAFSPSREIRAVEGGRSLHRMARRDVKIMERGRLKSAGGRRRRGPWRAPGDAAFVARHPDCSSCLSTQTDAKRRAWKRRRRIRRPRRVTAEGWRRPRQTGKLFRSYITCIYMIIYI